jgi:hypothetical protein
METIDPVQSRIVAMASSPLLRLSRVLEQRGLPLSPLLQAAEVSGTKSVFLAFSLLSPRLDLLVPYRTDALALVAPGIAAPNVGRGMLRICADGGRIGVGLASAGSISPGDAVNDVAPPGARAAWLPIVSSLCGVAGGIVTGRTRFFTEERGTIGVGYKDRTADLDAKLLTAVDEAGWNIGLTRPLRELWKKVHPTLNRVGVTINTACTANGPAPEVSCTYMKVGWDDAISLCKLVASVDDARSAAAALGTFAATLEHDQGQGVELVLRPEGRDVVVWSSLEQV